LLTFRAFFVSLISRYAVREKQIFKQVISPRGDWTQ
jgi:hypothetical protein